MTGNANVLREANTALVYRTLKEERQSTKLRLAQLTGLSTVTVGTALEQLLQTGAALEGEMMRSSGGRPARSYRFNADFRHGLALYIRENTLLIRVADLYGTCVYREEQPFPDTGEESLFPTIRCVLERYPSIGALGVGLPGVERDGVILASDTPSLMGARLTRRCEEEFGLPMAIENDVNLAVLGYCRQHCVEPEETVVYVYFPEGAGPGAGLSIGGRLHRGKSNSAGEIKWLPPRVDWTDFDWNDFRRVCGTLTAVAESYACILDPDRLVFHGPCLTAAHLEAVQRSCEEDLELGFATQLSVSNDFDSDYESGAIQHTLDLLECREGDHIWRHSF